MAHLKEYLASNETFPYRENMEVCLDPEQEAQLVQLAQRAGINAEHLAKNAILRLLNENDPHAAPELPVLHLGAVSSLHRSDIYDDVH